MTAAARLRSRVCAVGERQFGGWCVRTLRTRCKRTHLRPSVSTRCFLQLERRTALRTNCCSELAAHRSRKLAVRAAYDAFHDDSDTTAQSERATIPSPVSVRKSLLRRGGSFAEKSVSPPRVKLPFLDDVWLMSALAAAVAAVGFRPRHVTARHITDVTTVGFRHVTSGHVIV